MSQIRWRTCIAVFVPRDGTQGRGRAGASRPTRLAHQNRTHRRTALANLGRAFAIASRTQPQSSAHNRIADLLKSVSEIYILAGQRRLTLAPRKVGGWGSNPRPADYEKYGPALRALYRHGYHGVVTLVALIAPFARAARSTNRSTPDHGDHRMPATERYRRQGLD